MSAEWSYVEKQQQQIDLLLKTAEQRYLELPEKQPHIIRRTPQKQSCLLLGDHYAKPEPDQKKNWAALICYLTVIFYQKRGLTFAASFSSTQQSKMRSIVTFVFMVFFCSVSAQQPDRVAFERKDFLVGGAIGVSSLH